MNYSTIYRTLGILLFITFQTITAHAQFSVKGTLVDSLTHESEPYATIRITLDKSPEKPVRMNVTMIKDNSKRNCLKPEIIRYKSPL